MKRIHLPLMAGLILLVCTGCTQGLFATHNTPADLQQMQQGSTSTTPQANQHASSPQGSAPSSFSGPAPMTSVAAGQDCGSLAQSRMAMYDRPSTYPISDQERRDAYQALYSSCMRDHNFQVAGPVRSQQNYASLANLSPAAGGNRTAYSSVTAGNSVVSTSSVPGATVVVIGGNGNNIASQLSSLSPSSGSSSPNATVVLVQSPQQNAAPAGYPMAAYAPSGPLPVAVPITPPMATGYSPAAPHATMATPRPTMATPLQAAASQPSLASAETSATGTQPQSSAVAESEKANQQLENVLEQ